MWFYADMKAHVQIPTVLQQKAVNGGLCEAAAHLVFQDGVLETAHLVVLSIVVFHLEEQEKKHFQFLLFRHADM